MTFLLVWTGLIALWLIFGTLAARAKAADPPQFNANNSEILWANIEAAREDYERDLKLRTEYEWAARWDLFRRQHASEELEMQERFVRVMMTYRHPSSGTELP